MAFLQIKNCSTEIKFDEAKYEESIKHKILSASLPFVSKHGWSVEAIEKGAETMGYPAVVHGLFPRRGGELLDFFSSECNKKLSIKMKEVSINFMFFNNQ